MRKTPERDKSIFTTPEATVRAWLGVSWGIIKSRRPKLSEGVDWVLDWRTIYYSESGISKMYFLLGVERKVLASLPADEAKAEGQEAPEVKAVEIRREWKKTKLLPNEAVVKRANFRNNRLILASYGGKEIWVWVRDSKVYRPGHGIIVSPTVRDGYYSSISKPRRLVL
jgi:hypothetical protein